MDETPADKAIRLLGLKGIAGACDLDTDAVRKWSRRGGNIPGPHQKAVLALARERGVALTADDILGVAA